MRSHRLPKTSLLVMGMMMALRHATGQAAQGRGKSLNSPEGGGLLAGQEAGAVAG
jgi:hypothetical protein